MTFLLPISGRANWGSALPILEAAESAGVAIKPVFYASALLSEFGNAARHLPNALRLPCQSAGDTAADMSRTTAEATKQFAGLIEQERPRGVIIIGDRHEVLGPAIAAYQARVPIHHTMGGERSGTIDDVTRDVVSVMATKHYVATNRASTNVGIFMKRDWDFRNDWEYDEEAAEYGVHVTGCPRIDLVKRIVDPIPIGVGDHILVSMHPDTCVSDEENARATRQVLRAAYGAHCELWPTQQRKTIHVIWPCADAGHEAVAGEIRSFMHEFSHVAATHRTMDPASYYHMMATCFVMVGNSSSVVRESAYIGTPCVLVGGRQRGREKPGHITSAQLEMRYHVLMGTGARGRRAPNHLYGDGNAAKRIVAILSQCEQ